MANVVARPCDVCGSVKQKGYCLLCSVVLRFYGQSFFVLQCFALCHILDSVDVMIVKPFVSVGVLFVNMGSYYLLRLRLFVFYYSHVILRTHLIISFHNLSVDVSISVLCVVYIVVVVVSSLLSLLIVFEHLLVIGTIVRKPIQVCNTR